MTVVHTSRYTRLTLFFPKKVIDGMDTVFKIEAVGSGGGTPSKKVTIVESGEIAM